MDRMGLHILGGLHAGALIDLGSQQQWTLGAGEQVDILLADDEVPAGLQMHDVLINLGRATPPGFSRYERLIEVIGLEVPDREAGRERWRFYRDRGYPLHTHDLASQGTSA